MPVATTLMGVGGFPETHPLSMQWFGMHGAAYGNWAVDQSDLLLCFGARFDDRITGDTKNSPATPRSSTSTSTPPSTTRTSASTCRSQRRQVRARPPQRARAAHKFTPPDTRRGTPRSPPGSGTIRSRYEESKHILPQEAVAALYELTKGDAIITTGVGQHQMWAAQFYRFQRTAPLHQLARPRRDGLRLPRRHGRQGRLPGQAGHRHRWRRLVHDEHPGARHLHIEKIAAKAMILNNQHLGMVVQWEDRFYGSVRGNTILGDETNVGSPDNPRASTRLREDRRGLRREGPPRHQEERTARGHPGDARSRRSVRPRRHRAYTEHVLPMIPAGKTVKDMILKYARAFFVRRIA
jgi:acetolactate synthase-1/2/3 large subunit